MKVKALIDELLDMPQDVDVLIPDMEEDGMVDVLSVDLRESVEDGMWVEIG